ARLEARRPLLLPGLLAAGVAGERRTAPRLKAGLRTRRQDRRNHRIPLRLPRRGGTMSRAALFRLVTFARIVLALFLAFQFLPIKEPLANFLAWVQSLGVWGLVFLGAFYIPASLLLIPGSLVTIAGGAIFGFWETVVAISLGSTTGACAAFLVGRRF